MNKRIIIFCLMAVLLCSALVFALKGMNREQKSFYNTCNKNCSFTKMNETQQCNIVSYACMRACKDVRKNCTEIYEEKYDTCQDSCKNLTLSGNLTGNLSGNFTGNLSKNEKKILENLRKECRKNCSKERVNETRSCYKTHISCDQTCQGNKNLCKKDKNENYLVCKDTCFNQSLLYGPNLNQTQNNTNNTNETNNNEDEHKGSPKKVLCPRPRPSKCTYLSAEQYLPVCSNNNKTYSDGCMACMDSKVEWYKEGACKSD